METDEVFYVGKGCGCRYKSLTSRNKSFMEIFEHENCSSRIVFDGLNENDAFLYERVLVSVYKTFTDYRICNKIPGGKNPSHAEEDSPYKTDEFIQKMREVTLVTKNSNYGNKWTDSQKKRASDRAITSGCYNGHLNPNRKQIQCVETGEVFQCIRYAKEKYGVRYAASFSIALDKENRTAAGLHWITIHKTSQ